MAYRKELLEPKKVLELDVAQLSFSQLGKHLTILVLGEKDASDSSAYLYNSLKEYKVEFRAKRLLVAGIYAEAGT